MTSLFDGVGVHHEFQQLDDRSWGDDEAFLVLEGTFQFQIEGQNLQHGPGEFAFVPRNTPHTFLNTSAENEGCLLIITLPAGNHEGFFAEAGEPKASSAAPFSTEPRDIEKLVTVGKRHGFEILLPATYDMQGFLSQLGLT